MIKKIMLRTLEETEALAKQVAEQLESGDILCLSGDLGAGKTTFSQYLCRELGVKDYVTSPTFNIMNQYEGQYTIYHFDVYRIFDEDEMLEIGFEDFLFAKGICLIEWAEKVESFIPDHAIWMTMTLDDHMNRCVSIKSPRALNIGE